MLGLILSSLVLIGCGSADDSGGVDSEASTAGEVGFVPTPERPFENCTMVVSGTKGDGSKFSTCGGGPDEGLRYEWPVEQIPVLIVVSQISGALDIRHTNDSGGRSETPNWVDSSWSKTVTVNAGSYFSASAVHKSIPMLDVVARGKISISLSANGEEFCFSDGTNFVSCDGTVPAVAVPAGQSSSAEAQEPSLEKSRNDVITLLNSMMAAEDPEYEATWEEIGVEWDSVASCLIDTTYEMIGTDSWSAVYVAIETEANVAEIAFEECFEELGLFDFNS